MSAKGTKQTLMPTMSMSASGGKADMPDTPHPALQVSENTIAAFLMQRLEMLTEAILVIHSCLRLALTDAAQPSLIVNSLRPA